MNKAVELITAWGAFDARFPQGTLEEFCHYYLANRRRKPNPAHLATGPLLPPTIDGRLIRLLGRIMKLHAMYALGATEGTGIGSVEEFSLLHHISLLGEPRKTEAIYAGLFELSTGTDMLNRLKKSGYIKEYDDKEDKRSKRLKITTAGKKAMVACQTRVIQLAEMMLHDLSETDKVLCFLLLHGVETKFAALWFSHKSQNFDVIYKEVTGTKQLTNATHKPS